ncbi:MAG: glycosyltransferase family 2 protein, partial [Desulfomonile tiedjei]|nr:glycosyltransferase family 2 protein [Desulfomonile tiedjei]
MTIGPSEKKPLVSVVIPSYNHELYVRAAIESVLDSSVKNFEILVVDDGSTDQSVKIVNEMKDPRLKLFTQKNMGAHEAINRGVSLAAAPWIAILNSDDRFHPRKLEMHLELHASNPHLEASASRVRYIYEDGKPVPSDGYLAWRYGEAKRSYSGGKSLWISLIQTNHLVTTSSLFIGKAS